jgi:Fe-S cluster assembly protein SufD
VNVPSATLLDLFTHPMTAGSRAERGRVWLEEHGLPTAREEAWRYTPVEEVIRAIDDASPARASSGVTRAVVDELAGDHGGPRLVFVNGAFEPEASDGESTLDGLWLGSRDRAHERPAPEPDGDHPVDGFHALNWAAGRDEAAVIVAPHVHLDHPVHVVHVAVPGDAITVSHPRSVVLAGPGSCVQLIESFVGLPGAFVTNAATRIFAGEHSHITYARLQRDAAGAIHIGRTLIEQGADSTVRVTSIMTGGDIARSAVDVCFTGSGARADIDGLYLPTGHQRHDNVVTVDHAASRCTSRQRFKGIIDDHARGSFSGHVIVRPGTTATDADQATRNLVLRPTAQANTRPWLEIFADDVRCTHGAAVGRLDDDALFYLRSRGIPLLEARAMLVAAFAAEIIDTLTPTSLRELVAGVFADRTLRSAG